MFLRSSVEPGGTSVGYRANLFELSIESRALDKPRWASRIHAFWRAVSETIHPFFGDVRTLGGFERHSGTIYGGASHPITGAAWDGVPPLEGAHAMVVGPPLLDLWPEFRAIAEERADVAFLSTATWKAGSTLTQVIDRVPIEIARVPEGTLRKAFHYPSRFPFETHQENGERSFASGDDWFEHMKRLDREEERPIIAEFKDAGFSIDCVWDFVGTVPPQKAVQILLKHLANDYSAHLRFNILFALRKAKLTRGQIEELVALFTLASATAGEAERGYGSFLRELAAAVCRNLKHRDFDRMLAFIRDPKNDAARSVFIGSFARKFRARAVPVLVEMLGEGGDGFAALSALKALRDPSGIAFAERAVANRRLRSYEDSMNRNLAKTYLERVAKPI
jgi:hypothetical protein